jgi:hypothetical protein
VKSKKFLVFISKDIFRNVKEKAESEGFFLDELESASDNEPPLVLIPHSCGK